MRGNLLLWIAAVITGALFVCRPVVQYNFQTFLGPNGTEYLALQWATQLQWHYAYSTTVISVVKEMCASPVKNV